MASLTQDDETEKAHIVLGLLESVERDGGQSQRRIASELGIALGLVNAYLKRCVKKGFVKVSEAPARRYGYYLTPKGFAEKSRLTVEYLSYSFSFFRQARADCSDVFETLRSCGYLRVAVAGISDLAEIARICALECQIDIVAVVDPVANVELHIGLPVYASLDAVPDAIDAIVITDLRAPRATYEASIAKVGPERVFAPKLLNLHRRKEAAE